MQTNLASIPEPATEPDPWTNNQDWEGATYKGDPPSPLTLAGIVQTRESVKFATPRDGQSDTFVKLQVEDAFNDGVNVDVPCWRTHLVQLVDENDPQPGDGISITFFGCPDGKKYEYGMRVTRNGSSPAASSGDVPFE